MAKRRKRVSRTDAVKALELSSVRALDKLIERGAPPPTGKLGSKRYDVEAIRAWQNERAARANPNLDLAAERAKLARAQTELTEHKLREARGLVVETAAVEEVFRATAAAAKTQLLAVPRRSVLEGMPRKWERLSRRLITEALLELAETDTIAALKRLASKAK